MLITNQAYTLGSRLSARPRQTKYHLGGSRNQRESNDPRCPIRLFFMRATYHVSYCCTVPCYAVPYQATRYCMFPFEKNHVLLLEGFDQPGPSPCTLCCWSGAAEAHPVSNSGPVETCYETGVTYIHMAFRKACIANQMEHGSSANSA